MSSFPPELRFNEDAHPDFMQAFDDQARRSLLEDDSFAWRGICSILIAIVTFGLSIGVIAVLVAN